MITPECYKFCRENKLCYELELCLKAINKFFSGILLVSAEVDYFESACFDTGYKGHIVLRVKAKLSQDVGMIQYDEYISWYAETIQTAKAGMFVLSLHRV